MRGFLFERNLLAAERLVSVFENSEEYRFQGDGRLKGEQMSAGVIQLSDKFRQPGLLNLAFELPRAQNGTACREREVSLVSDGEMTSPLRRQLSRGADRQQLAFINEAEAISNSLDVVQDMRRKENRAALLFVLVEDVDHVFAAHRIES